MEVYVMVRKDGAFIKKTRLTEISQSLARTFPDGVNYEKFVKRVQFDLGLREDTARKYINLVLEAQGWFIRDEVIVAE